MAEIPTEIPDAHERAMTMAARDFITRALQAQSHFAHTRFADTLRVELPGGLVADVKIRLKTYPADVPTYAAKLMEQGHFDGA